MSLTLMAMAGKQQRRMMEVKFLTFTQSRLEYCRCVHRAGTGVELVSKQFAETFLTQLTLLDNIGHVVAVQIYEAFSNSCLSPETPSTSR